MQLALQMPACLKVDEPPSMEELEVEISQLKTQETDILPELLLCGGPVLQDRLC